MSAPTLTPPRGCSIGTRSEAEVAAHAALADELRGLVTALTSAPGRVTIALSIPADDARIARFVATERECCAFLSPEVGADVRGATITWSSRRPSDRDGLRSIAAMFDPARTGLPRTTAWGRRERSPPSAWSGWRVGSPVRFRSCSPREASRPSAGSSPVSAGSAPWASRRSSGPGPCGSCAAGVVGAPAAGADRGLIARSDYQSVGL